MPVESATYISGLNSANPVGATDPKSQGDDHLRLIKSTLLATFPSVTGAVTASHTELNYLAGATGITGTGNSVRSASPTFTGTVAAAAITASGTITGNLFSGSGASLTNLPAVNLTGGPLPALSGANLTNLNASNLASGSVADARLSANVPLLNASNTFTGATQTISATTARLNLQSTGSNNALYGSYSNGAARCFVGSADGTVVTGGTINDLLLRAESGGVLFSGNGGSTVHFGLSSSGVLTTPNASASEVGYKGTPQNEQSGSYTLVLSDAGKTIKKTTDGSTLTIPANASVAFPIGTIIRVIAYTSASISIAITSDTLYLAGTAFGTTGTRTLAAGGVAVLEKILSTQWMISGVGLS